MELLNFIQNNQITDYDSLKTILESDPFKLKIKEEANTPDLFLIYITDESNVSLKIVRECNGIILEKSTLKIICHTFEKCLDDENKIDERLDINNLYLEFAIEGTLVRLFYYNNSWRLASRKCIDASKSKWLSYKNFSELFSDCLNGINIDDQLNMNNCYSFIITHPENKIFVNYEIANIAHVSTRNMVTFEEEDVFIGIFKPHREKINSTNLDSLINYYKNMNMLNYEGIILIDNKFNRQKFKTNIFLRAKELWGNTNNRFMRYLELRKDHELLNQYLLLFDYDKPRFIEYESKISELAKKILGIYLDKHIFKKNIKIPYYFNKVIYKLHGDFLKEKVKTDYDKVMQLLLELDSKKICFIINHMVRDMNKILEDINNLNSTYESLMEE